jgi:hypothetical protein
LGDFNLAEAATVPLYLGKHLPPPENVVPKILPKARRERPSHIQQGEGGLRMRKTVVGPDPEVDRGPF